MDQRLSWVEVDSVRNLETQRIALDDQLTVISGGNAQGKSSVLEAVYLLATTRSFRTRDPREAIRHEGDSLRVSGGLIEALEARSKGPKSPSTAQKIPLETAGPQSPETAEEIDQKPPSKTLLENELRMSLTLERGRGNRHLSVGEYERSLRDYVGLLPALVMAGESVRETAGAPQERRRTMDRATAAARPQHLQDLADYRRALKQRNTLLRTQAPDAQLEPWEAVLGPIGERIAARRMEQLAVWSSHIGDWPALFPEGKDLTLRYKDSRRTKALARHVATAARDDEGDSLPLSELLALSRGRDRELGYTGAGPHRDDLVLSLGDRKSLWKFGSAGQVRSALAALTLAQARSIGAGTGRPRPLIALDDIDTDLDADRLSALLLAASEEGQVIAATSKPDIARQTPGRQLRAHEGRISEL